MAESLTDKFFWPIVVFAVLALGGFGWFFVGMTRSQWHEPVASAAPAPKAEATPAADAKPDTAAPETDMTETATADAAPDAASTEAPAESQMVASADNAPAAAAQPEAPPPEKPDAFVEIPTNKPFLSREDFAPKKPPAAPAKPGAKPAVPPGKKPLPGKPPAPGTPPAVAVTKPPAITLSSPGPGAGGGKADVLSLLDHRKVVVLNSGRKIMAVSVVDLGDSYGIKDDRQQQMTIKKDDVSSIQKP